MGHEEQAGEASPEAEYDVSNSWSAMSPGGNIGAVAAPCVSLLTGTCWGRAVEAFFARNNRNPVLPEI